MSKKTLDQALEPVPLWPRGFSIPVVQLIGNPGTGKSTFFAAMRDIDPSLRIVAADMEGSMANIGQQYGLEVIDVRQRMYDKFYGGKPSYTFTNGQLFETWLEVVTEHQGADILINDTISRVYLGSNEWTKAHPQVFGKKAENYWGDGQTFSWGDTYGILWPNIVQMLTKKFRLVALLSHMKNEYEKYYDSSGKEKGKKTGRQILRGVDFGDQCTLVIQLVRDPIDPTVPKEKLQTGKHGGLWARVVKDRIPHVINVTKEMLADQRHCKPQDIGDFDPDLGARNVALLPQVLMPENGQPYHRLLYHYMEHPQLDYGEKLNKLVYDPSAMTDEERGEAAQAQIEAETERASVLLKARTEERKQELMAELKEAGLYKTGLEVASALKTLGMTYSLEFHDQVAAALVDYARGNAAGS